MRLGIHCVARALVLASLFGCVVCSTTPAVGADDPELQPTGTCDQPLSFYSKTQYKIKAIRTTSAFDYLHGVRQMMSDVLASSNLHLGDDFTTSSVIEGRRKIRERLNQLADAGNFPIKVNVVIAEIEKCRADTEPPSLDVVYNTFSTWAPFVLPRTFEHQASQADDPASASGVRKKKFQLVPQAGYNATANLFGGGRTSLATRVGTFDVGGLASSEILSVDSSFSGKHTWEDGWIKSAEWRTGFSYYDAPTGTNRLKRARLTGQVFANSAPIGSSNAILRFGVSIGGGHDQSNLPADELPPGSLSSSPIGEVKTYGGISGRAGRNSFKFSYGFQLGEANSDFQVDFAKHIADVAYNVRFLPSPHKPVELDARLTAGWIQNLGAIPAAERFFGGNAEREFLMGDSWQIRAAPFIRSIPENQLNRLAPDAPIGGENFFSANVTLGVTAWNRQLMPEEIRANPDFRSLLASELKSAQKTLESYWISKDKAVPDVLSEASQAIGAVRELRKSFDRVKDSVPAELTDRFGDCDFQVTLAEGFADILETDKNRSKRFIQMKSLVAENDDGSIDNLMGCITDLRALFGTDATDAMVNKFKSVQDPARADLSELDEAAAQKKSARDMAFIHQTVNTVVDEMNFVSISPIAIFDVARIGPQASSAGGGFRYGLGGGVRFTLVDTIRLDAGYAVNPDPKPWEGRGAAFFSMQVIPLF
jgi:hypothetical protein